MREHAVRATQTHDHPSPHNGEVLRDGPEARS
jgi:hypothetical protein